MTTEETAAPADDATASEETIPVESVQPNELVVAKEEPAEGAEPEAVEPTEETTSEAAPEAGGKKAVPKLPDWAQKKLAEAAFNEREASRRAKAAEEELAKLKAPTPTAADTEAANAAAPAGGYKSPQDFDAAVQAEASRREQAARTADAERKFTEACNTAYTAGKSDPEMGENFDAAVANLQQIGFMDRAMLDVVLELDAPAKVLFALGSDPDKAAEIMQLPAAKRAIEIARLGLVDGTPKPQPTKLSNAPRPVSPVEGSARVTTDPADADDDATWFAKRQEQVQKRLRAQMGV